LGAIATGSQSVRSDALNRPPGEKEETLT